jgi:PhnB protein
MMADELNLIKNDIPSIFLTITFSTMDEVKKAFHILSKEGTIFYPLQSTTYSSCVGTVIDKFGYRWGLMTEHNHN